MNYKALDKDFFFETDHIISIDKATGNIKHETKMYAYDGKELKEIKSQQELNFLLYEIGQKVQEEFAKFSAKYAKPPIGYIMIGNMILEYMLNRNNVILVAYANTTKVEHEVAKDDDKIILKAKTIINKEWAFESTQSLSPEVKDAIAKTIEKALKSAMGMLKQKA
jgi:hypothetical protein